MKRITRDRFDKKIAGVCGGLGQYFQLDSSIIRLIFIVLGIFTGGLFGIVYLLCWWLFPLGPRYYVEATYKKLHRSRRNRYIAGICGGFGKYFRIDPNIFRLAFIILTFVTGIFPMVIAYVIGIVVIPEEHI